MYGPAAEIVRNIDALARSYLVAYDDFGGYCSDDEVRNVGKVLWCVAHVRYLEGKG